MSELLVPDRLTPAAAAAALGSGFELIDAGPDEIERTYLDTFDGLLHEEGLTLAHEIGGLTLRELESAEELARAHAALAPRPLYPSELPEGPLRDRLAEVCGVRALLPLVGLRTRVRALRVLDGERKTVVRMFLEEPSLTDGGARLRRRLRLEPVRGYGAELEAVRQQLANGLALQDADELLVEEAVRATGRTPGGISSKIHVELSASERADVAAARVLSRLLAVIEANVPGTLDDIDSEFLHDLRVSVRRSRSVQRECKGVFPPARLAHHRAEFKWLQQVTGERRDLDVYVLEFGTFRAMLPPEMSDELQPLLQVLRGRREDAHRRMARALRSKRAKAALTGWAQLLAELSTLPEADRPDAARPIAELAGHRITKVYKRIVKMGDAIAPDSPGEDYHELRKKGKELRYLLELFGAPLYPAEVVKPQVKTLKALQDVLGRHQDRVVQAAMLRSLRDEVAALPRGAAALMAMGVLVERLGEDERAARGEFEQRFASFADKHQRAIMKQAFA